ncbi:coproporphyrinogen-III oxidase family protein [Gynuella sp.]|uniref:coproporphyrinogen-III oxidase family protein n=1 Tax=Gynuella sp. TaxID=2969146 RepID=UPI003D11819B
MIQKWSTPVAADCVQHEMADVFTAGQRNHHISNTAYPIAHGTTWRPYRVKQSEHESRMVEAFEHLTHFSLYSHIPFCETRCYFCEYTVVGKSELDQTNEYMTALNRELSLYGHLFGRRTLIGFDIGGGTPSFVDAGLIDQHINQVNQHFTLTSDCNISIETTPKIASREPNKIHAYRQSGIKRISMGIQVTQPDLLKALGREGNGLQHIQVATDHIRQAGFDDFNIDLMYGFADQSMASWESTLAYAIKLNPEHITLYRMRYKLTRISHQASQVELARVMEQAKMAKTMLAAAGYHANPGKNTYTRLQGQTGTSSYLTSRVIQGSAYLGIGLGSQSFSDTTISYNAGAAGKNLSPYLKAIHHNELPIQDCYQLPQTHMMAKMVAVSLYFGEINLQYFQHKFGVSLEQAYGPAIAYALEHELMQYTNSDNGNIYQHSTITAFGAHNPRSLSLTVKGAQHFAGTIALFFAPSVQTFLLQRDPKLAEDMHKNKIMAEKVFARSQ